MVITTTPTQVHAYLYHKNWETRVAAGEAIAYLADIFQHQSPEDLRQHALSCGVPQDALQPVQPCALSFTGFGLQQVLDRGTPLGASGGQVGKAVGVGPTPPPPNVICNVCATVFLWRLVTHQCQSSVSSLRGVLAHLTFCPSPGGGGGVRWRKEGGSRCQAHLSSAGCPAHMHPGLNPKFLPHGSRGTGADAPPRVPMHPRAQRSLCPRLTPAPPCRGHAYRNSTWSWTRTSLQKPAWPPSGRA